MVSRLGSLSVFAFGVRSQDLPTNRGFRARLADDAASATVRGKAGSQLSSALTRAAPSSITGAAPAMMSSR
jgi:hypothetical protein